MWRLSPPNSNFMSLQLELAKANPSGFPRDTFTTLLTNYLDVTAASGRCSGVCDCFSELLACSC